MIHNRKSQEPGGARFEWLRPISHPGSTRYEHRGSPRNMRGVHEALQHHPAAQDESRIVLMTMAQEIDKLLNDYRAWLREKTTLREVNGSWVEITTPYLDRHSDALQIYARAENGGYVLTDDS